MDDSVVCRNSRGQFSRKNQPTVVTSRQINVETVKIDHNYDGNAHICMADATGCPDCCPGIEKLQKSKKINTSASWSSGRRLVEFSVLMENLRCCQTCLLGPLLLSHQTVKGEMKCGLGGYLYVQCTACLELNRVAYGSTHKTTPNAKGMPSFSVNTKLGAGNSLSFLKKNVLCIINLLYSMSDLDTGMRNSISLV